MNAVVAPQAAAVQPRSRQARNAALAAATTPSQNAAGVKASPASGAARKAPPGINGYEGPVGSFKQPMKIKLRSNEAIRLAERGFASAQESLYNMIVVLPRHQNEDQDAIRNTEAQLDLLFEGLAKDIRADLMRVREKAKQAGIVLADDNYAPLEATVDLYTKQAIQLWNILCDYDEMSALTFALMFASQMTNTERVRLYSNWRNRLSRFIRSLKYQYLQLRSRGALGDVEEPAGNVSEEALSHELDRLDEAAAAAEAGAEGV
ncbi:hypothetical protein ACQHIH_21585 (plasmid) [Xanthomonas sontii]|nr:hypothetical protein [Xanthomonas sacchari]